MSDEANGGGDTRMTNIERMADQSLPLLNRKFAQNRNVSVSIVNLCHIE